MYTKQVSALKISTKGRYGLRLMFELALHYGEGPISLKSIAAQQNISVKYLEQIIMQLSKVGLVESVRGAQGGYSLARDPSALTVGTILNALEGSLSPSECAEEYFDCPVSGDCVAQGVWMKIKSAIDDVVDNIYLSDLVLEQQGKSSCASAGCPKKTKPLS